MKSIRSITFLFLLLPISVCAYEATLLVDKEDIDINDTLKLELTIIPEKGENIEIKHIPGLQKFEQISTSHSTQIQTSSVQIDGNFQSDKKVIRIEKYILAPKKAGKFTLGPVALSDGTQIKTTNKVQVEVTGKKIFTRTNTTSSVGKKGYRAPLKQEKQDFFHEKSPNKYFLVLYVAIFFLSFIVIGYVFLKKKSSAQKQVSLVGDEVGEDFESIVYDELPDINDTQFIEKLESYITGKIEKKFHISPKTFTRLSQILDTIPVSTDKAELQKLIEKINMLKYSNILVSKAEILERTKQLF